MEDFSSELQKVLVPGSSFSEIELLNQPLSSNVLDYFSTDAFVGNLNASQPVQSTVQVPQQSYFCTFDQPNDDAEFCIQRHGKNVEQKTGFSEGNTSPDHGSKPGGDYWPNKVNGNGGRKRKREIEGKGDKKKEVIHVRAKRGQATDSHSLAERVRRERINEKLKVLQDLVPGCYKTMAMAAMLDVIINYVTSLQNQIEFLSMKLSAASMFYDFNSPEAEAIETILKTTIPCEAHQTETSVREEFKGTLPRLYSTWPF